MSRKVILAVAAVLGVAWAATRKGAQKLASGGFGGLVRKSAYGPQVVPWVTPSGIAKSMASGADETWGVYSALSLKIMDGKQGPDSSRPWSGREIKDAAAGPFRGWTIGQVLEEAYQRGDAAGCARWAHGFHYLQTEEIARAEGREAAKAALRYNCVQYSCNPEMVWLSGVPNTWTESALLKMADDGTVPDSLLAQGWTIRYGKVRAPVEHVRKTINAFREEFRALAPNVRLHLCPAGIGPGGLGADALNAQTLAQWDGLEKMVFSNWRKWWRKKYESGKSVAERAVALKPDFAYIPLPAAGPKGASYAGCVLGWVNILKSDPWPAFGIYFGNHGEGWDEPVNGNIPWDEAVVMLQTPDSEV